MDEFDAIADLVTTELEGKTREEQREIIKWAIAAERYRTINEVQQMLGNSRTEVEQLVPQEFHRYRNTQFIFRLISVANRARGK
jgi:hypothetical protein